MKTLMLNQKSGLKYDDIVTYVSELKLYQNNFVVFPSSLYIRDFIDANYFVGIQNIAEKDIPNQTGEITAEQALSLDVKYVIIGHSERRINNKEDSDVLINKFNEAVKNNMKIVYCVGESLVEYRLNETNSVIFNELDSVLSKIDKTKIKELYIAYEPIWAIGSGEIPTNLEIENVFRIINSYLDEHNIEAKILYGGSVKPENIEELCQVEGIDGFLVGGASNDYKKVKKMCEIINNTTK